MVYSSVPVTTTFMENSMEKEISKEFLYEELIVKKRYYKDVAKELGISTAKLRRHTKKANIIVTKTGKGYFTDLTNSTFDKLTVIKRNYDHKQIDKHRVIWLCKCECGKERNVRTSRLLSGEIKSCGCVNISYNFKGFKDVSGNYFGRLKIEAKRRNIEFSISLEDIWNLYEEQKRKCKLSNVPILFVRYLQKNRQKQTASVDRIDSTKGYTIDNIQIVHKRINFIKSSMKEDELLFWAKNIYLSNKKEADEINNINYTHIKSDIIETVQYNGENNV